MPALPDEADRRPVPARAHAALTVGECGETELLRRILARVPAADAAMLGAGDDAAVLSAGDRRVVITTDLMIEGPDFRLAWSSARDLARKACASNLADVAAMGAVPTAITVALALPGETSVSWVEELAEGFAEGLAEMAPGCGVIGGDLSTSGQLTIAITAFGDLRGGEAVRRSGAQPGDVLALSGPAGRSGAGLSLLYSLARDARGTALAEGIAALRSRGDAVASLVDWHLAPTIDASLGLAARDAGATAMMDVSDGLLLDATRLARASGVQLDIETSTLLSDVEAVEAALTAAMPGLDADERQARARELVVVGGEDHGLLATFPAGVTLPDGFRAIGRVHPLLDDDTSRVLVDGEPREARGWDPYAWDFSSSDSSTGLAS
ncbi:thiamine-phosphate kinase [Pseudoclavibacter sp. AY1F1]|uniref:thiamine-phosphate kinase n=1 Tax=Pseudoclavibacter sp. AY1F1 TaxID=2080583 RepID=UPI000CE9008C|nr:thiamine-phosphate kinase [Pseudoclavibacter sp. AY1F1]PPF46059.1 thiamine-phosphate kinase [Pseudoclavibacter sp. AY1F1]